MDVQIEVSGTQRVRRLAALSWLTGATAAALGAQALVALFLAASVSPEEFATWGLATLFLNASWLLGNLGLVPALMREGVTDPADRRPRAATSFTLLVAAGILATSALVLPEVWPRQGGLATDPVSPMTFFGLVGASLALLVVAQVPLGLLEAQGRFPLRSRIDLLAATVYSTAAGTLIALGYGVAGALLARTLQAVAVAVGAFYLVRIRPLAPRRGWRAPLRSIHVTAGALAFGYVLSYCFSNMPTPLVGKLVGKDALGYFSLSFSLAMLIPTFLGQITVRAFFPILSSPLQQLAVARNLRDFSFLTTFAAILLCSYLSIFGKFFLEILGDEWSSATSILHVLIVFSLLRCVILVTQATNAARAQPSSLALGNAFGIVIVALIIAATHPTTTVSIACIFVIAEVAILSHSVLAMPHHLMRPTLSGIYRAVCGTIPLTITVLFIALFLPQPMDFLLSSILVAAALVLLLVYHRRLSGSIE